MVQTTREECRVYVERELLEDVKKSVRMKYPETKRIITYTGLVDWALRKLLTLNQTVEAA